jgi:hypothetical protein
MKKGILRLAFTVLFSFALGLSASAQFALFDEMGRPIQAKQYVDVQGSPFLSDDWSVGAVKLTSNKEYDGMKLMYDQVDDRLIFKNHAGQAQLFAEPVREFTLSGRVFRKGFKPVDGASPMAFYEVLADGKTQLLKRTTKKIFEEVPYGSSTKVKKIQSNETYYLSKSEHTLLKIRKDKKALLSELSDKKPDLEKYIKTNRLDLKQDEDMAKLVAYYNTL